MSRSPVIALLVVAQALASLAVCILCIVWLFRTRDMTTLAVQSNAGMTEITQVRQSLMALLQDTVTYSEKSPSMRLLLQQMGVRVNPPGAAPAPAPTPVPAAPSRR
jgi:hypothetical protein